ncbi:glycosyltransferase involved in cell wall biosynthesis [Sphingomonas kyeonggiensis]|uniref:Glycosyltransferase involved in cell wall biosynthesis n=1 Tax=Sphingomonas kyeonggiensis TaxID=1268553 RepID=A0A7W7K2U0_9SPHN|nr:glycosyltransferase family 1 protein [Sphingomonas kyeonggiensis]MBB4839661.1 glycosyltransferase involved in cell wall biosynthesis [Sphingomonas kyeonggiensis]
MKPTELRVALFSGNYNYVRDGANQALNLLVGYLLDKGVKVRVYSPTTETPAFPPTGDLVSVPSLPVPGGRDEYRFAKGIKEVLPDLEAFAPNIVHISAPEILCHRAVTWARENNIAAVASVHTRFETYPGYYKIGFVTPLLVRMLTRLYNRVDMLLPPGRGMVELLQSWGVTRPMRIWSRGVNHDRFNPGRRSLEWRRDLGIQDDEVAVAFLGRLVLEKGLDIFAEVVAELQRRGVKHRVLVIGKGPAQDWFAERVPDAVFAGFQAGDDLGRAVASMDVFFNPSLTESFGNVTLEAMAAGVPVVAARAVGPVGMVEENVSGVLVEPGPGAVGRYADAIQHYCEDHAARLAAGKAGHEIASAYVWDAINQKVLDAYLETIEWREK